MPAIEARVLPRSHYHQSRPALTARPFVSQSCSSSGEKPSSKARGCFPGQRQATHRRAPRATQKAGSALQTCGRAALCSPVPRHGRHRRGSPHSLLGDKPLGTDRDEPWPWHGSVVSIFAIETIDFPTASGFAVKPCDFFPFCFFPCVSGITCTLEGKRKP